MAMTKEIQQEPVWHIDSGAPDHMCQHRNAFESYFPMQKKVYMADGKHTMAEGIGSVILYVAHPNGNGTIKVPNVLHTPDLSAGCLYNLQLAHS